MSTEEIYSMNAITSATCNSLDGQRIYSGSTKLRTLANPSVRMEIERTKILNELQIVDSTLMKELFDKNTKTISRIFKVFSYILFQEKFSLSLFFTSFQYIN
jgi:hypothetical protein